MATEVYYRNPHNYIRQLVECGGPFKVCWDRGMLVKRHIDPHQHAKLYFGDASEWDVLVIGPQGTAHLDADHDMSRPRAVYPTWSFGEDFRILEEMVSSDIGMDTEACSSDVPVDERPVIGQPRRVVVTDLPNAQLGANRPFYRHLRELQEEYPECNIMLHGSYSYRVMFGMGFGSADMEPRTWAANGKVCLPNGKVLAYARTVGQLHWVNLLGASITDLKNPEPRCIFNIKSARWAGEHFLEDIRPKASGSVEVDPDSPVTVIPQTATFKADNRIVKQEGDMIVCDDCSLAETCKLYREGSVCTVKTAETKPLADMFQSRDSSRIIDGLGAIVGAQTRRLEKGMKSEEEFGELDPEVSKMFNSVFANGVKLAKLVDPNLTKPLVQINNGNTAGAVAAASPSEMSASIVRALEDQGIKREDITPEMFESMLRQMMPAEPPKSIEGQVI